MQPEKHSQSLAFNVSLQRSKHFISLNIDLNRQQQRANFNNNAENIKTDRYPKGTEKELVTRSVPTQEFSSRMEKIIEKYHREESRKITLVMLGRQEMKNPIAMTEIN